MNGTETEGLRELIEGIRRLFTQLFTVAKQQDAFYPTGINHQFA